MPRYADIVAVRDALYEADAITMKGVRILNQFPTISPDEVRGVASWIPHGDCGVTECSACKWSIEEYVEYNYCPNCGARMKGAEDGTTD